MGESGMGREEGAQAGAVRGRGGGKQSLKDAKGFFFQR